MLTDVDEWNYSKNYGSIIRFLQHNRRTANLFSVVNVKFGSSGVKDHQNAELKITVDDSRTGTEETSNFNSFLPMSTSRAPHLPLDTDYSTRYSTVCCNKTCPAKYCGNGGDKAIFRTVACNTVGVHGCGQNPSYAPHIGLKRQRVPALADLRINHYYLRHKRFIKELPKFANHKVDQDQLLNRGWFSSVEDNEIVELYS